MRYFTHKREVPGTDSGWKHAVNGKVIPETLHEVVDRTDGRIVAVFGMTGPGMRPGHVCAILEVRWLNGDLSPAAMRYWEEARKG